MYKILSKKDIWGDKNMLETPYLKNKQTNETPELI